MVRGGREKEVKKAWRFMDRGVGSRSDALWQLALYGHSQTRPLASVVLSCLVSSAVSSLVMRSRYSQATAWYLVEWAR